MLELTTTTGARMLCDAKNITAVMGVGDYSRVYFGLQGWAVDVVDDPDRVLDARRRALRDERAERFAVAIASNNEYDAVETWSFALTLADVEPADVEPAE